MQAEHSDTTALDILNNLRQLEGRKQLSVLPNFYRQLSHERQVKVVEDWIEQIEIHTELKNNSTEYNNRIILNETEQALYARNKRYPDNPVTYLKHSQVSKNDRDLYFPFGLVDPEERAYVTDTLHTYIQSLSVTEAKGKNVCIAKHSLPDCISYVPGPSELTLKTKRAPSYQPDPSLVVETRLRPRQSKTPDPTLHSDAPQQKSKETKTKILSKAPNTPTKVEDIFFKTPKNPIPSGEISSLGAAGSYRSSHPNLTTNLYSSQFTPDFISPFTPEFIATMNKDMSDSEVTQYIEAKVSELIHKHMEEMFNKSGFRPHMTPPDEPKGDDNDIEYLRKEVELLRASQNPTKLFVSTDKQLILDMRKDLSDMATYVHKLQGDIEKNKLLPEEKLKLQQMSGPTSTTANPLIYKLEYPTNLISERTVRGPLSILKPPSVLTTIGAFDPDNNPKANFKETWERIQNYTRNYDLYEHEYVDILMILMKGSAASALTDMIREYGGKLSKIIEAIQDIYVPQHTVFDDMDDLNKFTRPPLENIRTTMRRAGLLINRMKHQCSPAAWVERRYHMLTALIKQVIHIDTARHLYAEELKCAQAGTQLDIPAIITIIALHEQTHDLIPKHEMRLRINLNSMQVIDHTIQPIKALDLSNKKKEPRYPSDRMTRSKSRELITTPDKNKYRDQSRDRQRENYKSIPKVKQNTPYNKEGQKPRYRSESASSQYNYSQRRPDGQRDYKRKENQIPSRSQSTESASNDRQRSKSREDHYRNKSPYRPNYGKQDKTDEKRKPSATNDRTYSDPKTSKYERTFRQGRNLVTLHFYKCQVCPSMHPTGLECNNSHPHPLNM